MPVSSAVLSAVLATLVPQSSEADAPTGAQVPQESSAVATVPADQARMTGETEMPMSLQDALAFALTNNLGLERAQIESEAARFDALSTWGSFDWVFDGSANYVDAEQEGGSALFGGQVVTNRDTNLGLGLTRPLTTGGRFDASFDTNFSETDNQFANAPELFNTRLGLTYVQPLARGAWSEYATTQQREAELLEQRRYEERREARQFLIHDVEVAYWELVAAQEQLEVAEAALELGREQVAREEARLRAGDGTEVDVLQAQTEVATRTETLLQTQNDVAQRSDDLKRLIVSDDASDLWTKRIRTTTDLPEADPDTLQLPDWNDAFQVALGRRSELRAARIDVDTSRVRLTRAQSERLYGLDLELAATSGSFDEEFSESFDRTTGFDFPRYSVTLNYNMPLQNRTASNAEYAARERLRGSQVTLEEAEVNALADVRRAIREVRFRAQAVKAAQQSFTLARRQLEAEQQRFEADLTTTFEVLQFQQTLIEVASSRSMARAEYAKALVGLERAQGTIGETD